MKGGKLKTSSVGSKENFWGCQHFPFGGKKMSLKTFP